MWHLDTCGAMLLCCFITKTTLMKDSYNTLKSSHDVVQEICRKKELISLLARQAAVLMSS